MKTNLKINSIYFFILMMLFTSCQKDTDTFIPVESEQFTASIFGTVLDEAGSPLADVEVSYGLSTATTDIYGTYLFKNVVIDSRYNRIDIRKEGYFRNTRTFRAKADQTVLLSTKLMNAMPSHKMRSDEPHVITQGPIMIDFDGNGMVRQSSGEPYIGTVDVAIRYLNPLDRDLGDVMPGDLSAVNSSNQIRLLESFGMIGVELTTEAGQPLQLSVDSRATISLAIPEELLAEATDEIPLWHFDHETGLWAEEGKATKVGNTYSGEVSHFSFWNFDLQRPPVMVSGRLVDINSIGLAAMQVKVMKPSESRGGSGYTDFDGYFNGPIEKGIPLELSVVSKCDGEKLVYTQQIGPFEDDTDLGDIVLDIPNIEYLTLRGMFQDCDGSTMTEGLVKINDQGRAEYLPILGGSIDKTFGICGLDAVDIDIIDRNTLLKTSLGTVAVPGMIDIGTIKVCDEAVFFTSITSPTFDVDLVMVDSVSFTPIGTSKSILAFDYSFEVGVVEIKYVDNDTQGIETGTHDILKMVFNYRPNTSVQEVVLNLDAGTITIDEVDQAKRTVKGTYTFKAIVDGIEELHTFNGEFYSGY